MSSHFIIPDTQVKPGVPLHHLTAAGNYIADHRPDTIIHLGDHWDMPSLSYYDKGKVRNEGARYTADVEAGKEAMEVLLAPIHAHNRMRKRQHRSQYRPRMVFLPGNHENRIVTATESDPKWYGHASMADLEVESFGWETHPYLQPVVIDGVSYCHYYYNPMSGKPWGGKASTKLNNIGFSFTMGHQQGKDQAEKYLANGRTLRGLVVGSFYQHDEAYKGPQANDHWRGCIYKTEVRDGNYCVVELSLDYLMKRWL